MWKRPNNAHPLERVWSLEEEAVGVGELVSLPLLRRRRRRGDSLGLCPVQSEHGERGREKRTHSKIGSTDVICTKLSAGSLRVLERVPRAKERNAQLCAIGGLRVGDPLQLAFSQFLLIELRESLLRGLRERR